MATWFSGISKQHRIIRNNAYCWFGWYLLLFVLMLLRFGWLQVIQGAHYRHLSDRLITRTQLLPAERGKIYDRNFNVLALDDQRESLYADPSLIPYPEFIAQQLAPVIKVPAADLLVKFTQRTLRAGLTQQSADAVRAFNLPGIFVNATGTRIRIGVDVGQIDGNVKAFGKLARALGLTTPVLAGQLHIPDPTPPPPPPPVVDPQQLTTIAAHHAKTPARPMPPAKPVAAPTPAPAPVGVQWLAGSYPDADQANLAKLNIPGLQCVEFKSFAVAADQRLFAGDTKTKTDSKAAAAQLAQAYAVQLAVPLGMSATNVQELLTSRARFVMLCPELTEEMQKALTPIESTLFVVEPGAVLTQQQLDEEGKVIADPMTVSLKRLDDMLNPKKKTTTKGHAPVEDSTPVLVSREEIWQHLQPGAQPGVLAVKSNGMGMPDISITRRLFHRPIPGVIYGLPGISIQQNHRRHYYYDTLASATLGWVGNAASNPHGAFGLEASQDKQLQGKDGEEIKEIDERNMTIPERSKRTEPVNGRDVVTTLDLSIQQAAETALHAAVDGKATRGECIVMDPNTGEILAMATAPAWDANAPSKSGIPYVNTAISNFYEPGSTFKVLTVMAALEEGVIKDGQIVTDCRGPLTIGHNTIHESHGYHGEVDCGALLEKSCNEGAAVLAMRLGADRFLPWCEKLGFGQKTGIELANESPGSLNKKNAKAKITLANMGFGQSLAVTPVQMAALYSAAANGGVWVQPHLIKSQQNPDGSWTATKVPRRRVCTPETAALLRKYLERVVSGKSGTGKAAAIAGYRIGGKTGTAEKAGLHGYREGKYIGSFIGVMPLEKPRLTIITVIDEPKLSHYGAVVACPAERAVALRALEYLNIPPTLPVKTSQDKH